MNPNEYHDLLVLIFVCAGAAVLVAAAFLWWRDR